MTRREWNLEKIAWHTRAKPVWESNMMNSEGEPCPFCLRSYGYHYNAGHCLPGVYQPVGIGRRVVRNRTLYAPLPLVHAIRAMALLEEHDWDSDSSLIFYKKRLKEIMTHEDSD